MSLASFTLVTSRDDPRVDAFARVRERDLAGREGLFVAEGENVLRVLAERGMYRVKSVLLAEKRIASLEEVVASFGDHVARYAMPQAEMDALVGFPIHRGVLALAERGTPREAASLVKNAARDPGAIGVCAVGVVNHDNVGGIFRNAAAFGAAFVLIDDVTCDPLYRKAVRVSVGGTMFVPFARVPTAEGMLELLRANDFEAFALSPRGAIEISEIANAPVKKRALILGPEGPGLPQEFLDKTSTARVAMAPELDSLNVAVTAGIALHALFTSSRS